MRVFKFLAAGGIGVSVNLGLFHTFYILGVPYLIGSAVALLLSMMVGFVLQKYWTFEDGVHARAPIQFAQYATLTLFNLAINTLVVYLLVEKATVYPLFAQAAGAALVAVYSFFVYRLLIFSQGSVPGEGGKL